ncbi:hypothetical protein EBV26_10385 [bacterium]|nr:hypothetical protein [bacterium]
MNMTMIICLFFLICTPVFTQSGATMKEFEQKLSDYYDPELINDVVEAIGINEKARVWSWDIGDYSSDEHNDIACVVRYAKEQSKQCSIFFFVDINGTLTPVGSLTRGYIDSPLEVGVAIKNATCYVTSKKEQFNWNIVGYAFRHGIFFEADTFSTSRIGNQTMEVFKDHVQRRNSIHVFSTRSEETSYYHFFQDIPVFRKDEHIIPCFAGPYYINKADDVGKGAFFWRGPTDASMMITESTFDDSIWNIRMLIKDDTLTEKVCDTCIQDKISILLSTIRPGYDPERKERQLSQKEKETYVLELIPSFTNPQQSSVSIIEKKTGIKRILTKEYNLKKRKDGYEVYLSIPFTLLPEMEFSGNLSEKQVYGCTFIVTDCDNPYRPEEVSLLYSSDFESNNVKSLGTLTFYPSQSRIANVQPQFLKEMTETLQQLGF